MSTAELETGHDVPFRDVKRQNDPNLSLATSRNHAN